MKTAVFPVIAGLSDTLPSPGDPTYQTEALSLFLRKTFQNMEGAGMTFTAPEATDFSAFNGDFNTFLENANTRMDEILSTGFSSVIANVPDVLSIMAAISSGGGSEVISILLRAIIGHMFHDRDSAIAANQGEVGNDVADMSAVVTAIENVRGEIELLKRGLIVPANGDSQYLVDNLTSLLTSLEQAVFQVLSTININLLSDEYEAYFSATQDTGEDDN